MLPKIICLSLTHRLQQYNSQIPSLSIFGVVHIFSTDPVSGFRSAGDQSAAVKRSTKTLHILSLYNSNLGSSFMELLGATRRRARRLKLLSSFSQFACKVREIMKELLYKVRYQHI